MSWLRRVLRLIERRLCRHRLVFPARDERGNIHLYYCGCGQRVDP